MCYTLPVPGIQKALDDGGRYFHCAGHGHGSAHLAPRKTLRIREYYPIFHRRWFWFDQGHKASNRDPVQPWSWLPNHNPPLTYPQIRYEEGGCAGIWSLDLIIWAISWCREKRNGGLYLHCQGEGSGISLYRVKYWVYHLILGWPKSHQ